MSAPVTAFVHVPKTGGTTLTRLLSRLYGHDHVVTSACRTEAERAIVHGALAERDIRLVTGHMFFGLHTWVGRPVRYITMLRHPAQRSISGYYHVKRNAEHPAHQNLVEGGYTIAQWVERQVRDMQTHLIAGSTDLKNRDNLLQRAKTNLREHFVTVGLTERFDESLIAMRRALDLPMPYYLRYNVGGSRRRDHDPALLEMISEYHALDVALWEYANHLLDEQIAAQGAGFRRDLRWFQLANPLAQRVVRMRNTIRGHA